jgi:hypothetical protein
MTEATILNPQLADVADSPRGSHSLSRVRTATSQRRAARIISAILALLTICGFAVRLAISWVSVGSNDAELWQWFATLTLCTGTGVYELVPAMNHPPIPVIWSVIALLCTMIPGVRFPFVFRLAPIMADVGSAILLYRIWRSRSGDTVWGWLGAAAMAWNLDAILIGAFHCNTDNIVAFFSLLSAYYISKRSPRAAGLALAAGINIKLAPVILIPAIASAAGSWRELLRFTGGLAVGTVPFLLMLAIIPQTFARNVLGYNPAAAEWGLLYLFSNAQVFPVPQGSASRLTAWYLANGKYFLLAAVTAVGLIGLIFPRRWNVFERGALAWALFIVLAPGFGVQYTVYPVTLMLASCLARGTGYGIVAGLFALLGYAAAWDGNLPINGMIRGHERPNNLLTPMGLVAWAAALGFVVTTLFRQRPVITSLGTPGEEVTGR